MHEKHGLKIGDLFNSYVKKSVHSTTPGGAIELAGKLAQSSPQIVNKITSLAIESEDYSYPLTWFRFRKIP